MASDTERQISLQLQAIVPGLVDVMGLRRLTGGSSHETWAFDAKTKSDGGQTDRRFILRREFEQPLFDMSMTTEFELLGRLHRAGLAVPQPHFVWPGDMATGAPFMIMERIVGLDMRKAMAANCNHDRRRAIGMALVDSLAVLHAQPVDALRDILRDASRSPRQELERWRTIVNRSGYSSAALHLALAWLESHCPANAAPVIVHGDFKANNVLLGESTRPVIIDWELAHIGDRLEDLAWTMLWTTPDDLVGGMMSPAEFLEQYEHASGTQVDRRVLHFWKLFSLVKLAAIFFKGIEPGPKCRPPRPTLLMLAQALPCIEEAIAALLLANSSGPPV